MKEKINELKERVKGLEFHKENWIAWLIVLAVVSALLYVFCVPSGSDDVRGGFNETRGELQSVGTSLTAISDGAGRSEEAAESIGRRADQLDERAGRLGGSLQRVKSGVGEAKGRVGKVEERIILAESLIGKGIGAISQSRTILKQCREGLPAGQEKAGKAD